MVNPVSTRSEIFFGWRLTELEELLQAFKTQVQEEGLDRITSAGLNGKSVMNGQRMALKEWMIYLREALQELDPLTYGTPVRAAYSVACGGYMPK